MEIEGKRLNTRVSTLGTEKELSVSVSKLFL